MKALVHSSCSSGTKEEKGAKENERDQHANEAKGRGGGRRFVPEDSSLALLPRLAA